MILTNDWPKEQYAVSGGSGLTSNKTKLDKKLGQVQLDELDKCSGAQKSDIDENMNKGANTQSWDINWNQ